METNQNCKSNKIYKVQLKFQEADLVTFSASSNLDECIGLALMLHAKSNMPHQVFVDDGEQLHCVLNLYSVDPIDVLTDSIIEKCL